MQHSRHKTPFWDFRETGPSRDTLVIALKTALFFSVVKWYLVIDLKTFSISSWSRKDRKAFGADILGFHPCREITYLIFNKLFLFFVCLFLSLTKEHYNAKGAVLPCEASIQFLFLSGLLFKKKRQASGRGQTLFRCPKRRGELTLLE